MTSYVVATVAELPPGSRKIVEVGGREVGIFNVDGTFYAIRNRCPHQAGPVCKGLQVGDLVSDRPGEYRWSGDQEIVQYPWHQWEFDLRTGQSWFDPRNTKTRAYPVRVEYGAEVLSEIEADTIVRGKIPGPYTAEIYSVSVEDTYVVIDVEVRVRGVAAEH